MVRLTPRCPSWSHPTGSDSIGLSHRNTDGDIALLHDLLADGSSTTSPPAVTVAARGGMAAQHGMGLVG